MPTPEENRRARINRYYATNREKVLAARRMKRAFTREVYVSGACLGCGWPITEDDQIPWFYPCVHRDLIRYPDCIKWHRANLRKAQSQQFRNRKSGEPKAPKRPDFHDGIKCLTCGEPILREHQVASKFLPLHKYGDGGKPMDCRDKYFTAKWQRKLERVKQRRKYGLR